MVSDISKAHCKGHGEIIASKSMRDIVSFTYALKFHLTMMLLVKTHTHIIFSFKLKLTLLTHFEFLDFFCHKLLIGLYSSL